MQINRCPKCGWSPSEITRYTAADDLFNYEIECYDCGLHTGACKTHKEAVKKWNEMTEAKNGKHV